MKKYVKKFEEGYKVNLVKLIDGKGKIINKKGFAIEGTGIFDTEDKEYIAGYDKSGELYASNIDENNYILDFNGKRTRYKI